jgi:hypothetical protein
MAAGANSGAGTDADAAGGATSNTGIVVAINSLAIPLQVRNELQPIRLCVFALFTSLSAQHAPDNDPRKRKLRNNIKRSKNKQRQKNEKA